MKKTWIIVVLVAFLMACFLETAIAMEKGNNRKGKYTYRKVYSACHERGEVTDPKPPISPDAKTQAQWEELFDTKAFEEFGCKQEWDVCPMPISRTSSATFTITRPIRRPGQMQIAGNTYPTRSTKRRPMMTIPRFKPWMMILGLCLLVASCGAKRHMAAQAPETPDWFFHDIVDAEFVKQHVQIPMSETVMLIDARPEKPKYINGHIPMAINIPNTHFDTMTDKLPADKGTLLIYYCEGPDCKLSHKSAKKAEALGYTNVKVFAEGFPGWMTVKGNYASVSAEWVRKQLTEQPDMMLIDSRPKRTKYDKGHIESAVSIPDMDFEKMKDQLPADKNRLLVFYCEGHTMQIEPQLGEKSHGLGVYQRQGLFRRVSGMEGVCRRRRQGKTVATPLRRTLPASKVKAGGGRQHRYRFF